MISEVDLKDMGYDEFTAELAKYPKEQNNPKIVEAMYCALGLVGEAGEVSEKIKKWHRDGVLNSGAVALELGDVAYYLTRLANNMGYTLQQILDLNKLKLIDRRSRGVLKGSGDER
jgi:NTP pyrophosphatase (non-canonical NTP hydrolase)